MARRLASVQSVSDNDYSMAGNRVGMLTIQYSYLARYGTHSIRYCHCLCDCGKEKDIQISHMRDGETYSCGCYRKLYASIAHKKHGGKGTRIYKCWASMRERIHNSNNKYYSEYGERGITICPEWDNIDNGFVNFAKDMGAMPVGMSIDRIEVNGNYCPDNCRWATTKQQQSNKRNTRYMEYNGRSVPIVDVARELDISYATLIDRLDSGMSDYNAINKINKRHNPAHYSEKSRAI